MCSYILSHQYIDKGGKEREGMEVPIERNAKSWCGRAMLKDLRTKNKQQGGMFRYVLGFGL
jgi:hypothetical protein